MFRFAWIWAAAGKIIVRSILLDLRGGKSLSRFRGALSSSSFEYQQSEFLTALRAGPPFSWGVTSGGAPGGRALSKDGTRADSAKDFCRLVGGVYYAGNLISD